MLNLMLKGAGVRFELVMTSVYRRACIQCATEACLLMMRVFDIINNAAFWQLYIYSFDLFLVDTRK